MRQCIQCGKCCLKYSANSGLGCATEKDFKLWKKHRPDILAYADCSDLWVSPVTGEEMDRCPWLRKLPNKDKYKCRIYEARPEVCRNYPRSIEQMIKDGCGMLEDGDLDKPLSQLEAELKLEKTA